MVQVSEVEYLPGQMVRIAFDDSTSYRIRRSMYRERPLEVGESVDPEEYARWVLMRQYRSALDKAVAMLARRACSIGEIRQKLQRIGYSEDTVEMVICKLEKTHLVDDRDFADQWTRYRAGQKYGPRRISQELRHKGVSQEETEEALREMSEEEQLENAAALVRKALQRTGAEEDPRKTGQKILASIVRRGYDWDVARQAVEREMHSAGEEEE